MPLKVPETATTVLRVLFVDPALMSLTVLPDHAHEWAYGRTALASRQRHSAFR